MQKTSLIFKTKDIMILINNFTDDELRIYMYIILDSEQGGGRQMQIFFNFDSLRDAVQICQTINPGFSLKLDRLSDTKFSSY